MEKLAYLLWKGDGQPDAFRDRLLAKLSTRLPTLGAESLAISVVDSDVAAGTDLHMGKHEPDALLTFWLESAQDRAPVEGTVGRFVSRMAGYLVVESRPLIHEPSIAPGQRVPGFNLVGCITPKPGMAYADFIDHWYRVQRDVAVETQSSLHYVRNEIVRPLTASAPTWVAVVEEGFPIGALDDPKVFYDAEGSQERYQAHLERMTESCQAFLDFDNLDSHPMSEYRF